MTHFSLSLFLSIHFQITRIDKKKKKVDHLEEYKLWTGQNNKKITLLNIPVFKNKTNIFFFAHPIKYFGYTIDVL